MVSKIFEKYSHSDREKRNTLVEIGAKSKTRLIKMK